MFGYVKTDMPYLYVKDMTLYRSMYCGLCKSIGKTCGTKGRFLLNYDLTFLSVLAHNLSGKDVKIEKQRCIIHHVIKRPIAVPDELTDRIAALNVILAHHKLSDDVIDDGKGRIGRAFFKSAYKRAKKQEPILDEIVKKRYADLLAYEKTNGSSIDIAADPFGNMVKDVMQELLGDKFTEAVGEISYNLGKWIYLIDALDDFDKDIKKNNYNVFVNNYADVKSKEQLLKEKQQELIYVFGLVLGNIAENSRKLEYKFNHDLTDNVFIRGLNVQTKTVMENEKCKNTTKF